MVMKRGRNQRRRQGVNPNRAYDSNGPDVRIRGTANQIHDKYLALARDAAATGDRVKAENYLQHAEHYFRLIRAMQPSAPSPAEQPYMEGENGGGRGDSRGDDEAGDPPATDHARGRPNGARRDYAETADADSDGDGEAGNDSSGGEDGAPAKPRRKRRARPTRAEGAPSESPVEEPVAG